MIVGAGPVGLTCALELARFGVPSIVLEAKPHLVERGSRAIVLARHALEAFRRVGCGDELVARGVVLERARTYYGERELSCVEFPPVRAREAPLFLNLQQTYTERALLTRCGATGLVDIRWSSRVEGVRQDERGVTVAVANAGDVSGSYVIGCDGAHSVVRKLAGVTLAGRTFHDRFLIADIRTELPFPNERRFFFDPPSNPGRQILVHPQPDGEWRIDWQVAPETDPDAELASGALDRRIRAIVGRQPYEVAWITAYRFHQRLADRFRVGRIFLAGDAAHLMAPFGARGLNSGVEDAGNLAWKLAFVLRGLAPPSLLDSYERERRRAARENIRVTSATMRFMAPPTPLHRLARNAVLRGSVRTRALRRFVNAGKLAVPASYGPPGRGVVGRWAPSAGVGTVDALDDGFAVGRVRSTGAPVLVRPDGYVAAELGHDDRPTLEQARAATLRTGLAVESSRG